MSKKRRLTDLFVVGKTITFDDGQGEPIEVYLRKLSINDHEDALRRANAARARTYAQLKDTDSTLYQSIASDTYDLEHDQFVEALTADDVAQRTPAIEAEVSAQDRWSKDEYLQGLQDSWAKDLQVRYLENNEDEEAVAVYDELQEYASEVMDRIHEAEAYTSAEWGAQSTEDLRQEYLSRVIKAEGNRQWIRELRRCEVFLSTRVSETDRRRYFSARDEVDDLDPQVFATLLDAYRTISVDPDQGKSLQPTQVSSPPSEPPEQPETVEVSGLQAVPA